MEKKLFLRLSASTNKYNIKKQSKFTAIQNMSFMNHTMTGGDMLTTRTDLLGILQANTGPSGLIGNSEGGKQSAETIFGMRWIMLLDAMHRHS